MAHWLFYRNISQVTANIQPWTFILTFFFIIDWHYMSCRTPAVRIASWTTTKPLAFSGAVTVL